jgi:hypothetical protein
VPANVATRSEATATPKVIVSPSAIMPATLPRGYRGHARDGNGAVPVVQLSRAVRVRLRFGSGRPTLAATLALA